jgi:hypothetical protein
MLEEDDRVRETTALERASQREHQYPLPSFAAYEDAQHCHR